MYEWILALHVISVISWMAGLLYLPRLFIYHVDAAPGSEMSETFKVMERRLYRAIMTPAMAASWIFGLWLAFLTEAYFETWFHIKFILIFVLSGSHQAMGRWRLDFAADNNQRPAKFFRYMNEVPTVLMIAIVIFVIVKPF